MSVEEKPLRRVMTRDGPSVHVGPAASGDRVEHIGNISAATARHLSATPPALLDQDELMQALTLCLIGWIGQPWYRPRLRLRCRLGARLVYRELESRRASPR